MRLRNEHRSYSKTMRGLSLCFWGGLSTACMRSPQLLSGIMIRHELRDSYLWMRLRGTSGCSSIERLTQASRLSHVDPKVWYSISCYQSLALLLLISSRLYNPNRNPTWDLTSNKQHQSIITKHGKHSPNPRRQRCLGLGFRQ